MKKFPNVRRGDDWIYIHTVTPASGVISDCRFTMTWKYRITDPDSAAAAQITSDDGGGIEILSETEIKLTVAASVTNLIRTGWLFGDIQIETPDGKVSTEIDLETNLLCVADVTRSTRDDA